MELRSADELFAGLGAGPAAEAAAAPAPAEMTAVTARVDAVLV